MEIQSSTHESTIPTEIIEHLHLTDISWGNDISPSFGINPVIDGCFYNYILWVECVNKIEREWVDYKRFTINQYNNEGDYIQTVFESEYLSNALNKINEITKGEK